MTDDTPAVTIAMRIPGPWASPPELIKRLPADHRLEEAGLVLPDGLIVGFGAGPPDGEFPEIFRTSCRKPPGLDELAAVNGYRVNAFLSGPGGSLDAARTMMRAAAALLRAGGAGVFIDNCVLAHGGRDWHAMTEDGGSDAISYAFANVIGGKTEVYTMGMHVLGLRDIVMKRADVGDDGDHIIDVIRYLARNEKPIEDGHLIVDLSGPRFTARVQADDINPAGSPLHNPFGRLRLVSMRDIAEANYTPLSR